MDYDVVIIGSGPAGLFAANELMKTKSEKLKVLVVDKGKEPLKRAPKKEPKDLVFGVGGAGMFSDGKLNLSTEIGGDAREIGRDDDELLEIIEYIDKTLGKYCIIPPSLPANETKINELKKQASIYGIEFVYGKQKHIGTDVLKGTMDKIYKDLKAKGIEFMLETSVEKIKKTKAGFELETDKGKIVTKYVLSAPGRSGAHWFKNQAQGLNLQTKPGYIDVGVRVEFPAEVYKDVEEIMYDAKFKYYTPTYDDLVRTFCTNPRGMVVKEQYEGFSLVNGHAESKGKTQNTNFALLVRVELSEECAKISSMYGEYIARLANITGNGKPILQRYKDLKRGRRSNWDRLGRSFVKPSCKDAYPGEISYILPHRILINIIETIDNLDKIMPGLASDTTLLYAPEIKFYETKYKINKDFETNVEGLFVAGDASGFSRGIIFSALTGILAARGIKNKK
ncbi:MAG: FAD-dependent oxidoreductase [Euryarchaeota archaeon HGW-Euryarchaeota-1]|nr:MAG: FAD-dependent oxidoreductase [Euryarchaeota archaeon HGW-Euryarchaeota-1]